MAVELGTSSLLALLSDRERKASEIRQNTERATYAALGLFLAATSWALADGHTPTRLVCAAVLNGAVAVCAAVYLLRRQQEWSLEHEVIVRICGRLGCFAPAGNALFPDRWNRTKVLVVRNQLFVVAAFFLVSECALFAKECWPLAGQHLLRWRCWVIGAAVVSGFLGLAAAYRRARR